MIPRYAIIVAGGLGERMGARLPKQFIAVDGSPIMVHTIRRFLEVDPPPTLILVLPSAHHTTWEQIASEHLSQVPIVMVDGGETRFHSVKNGLVHIHEEGIVSIHDAVRPAISPEIIERGFQLAEAQGSAVTAVRLKDSIRELTPSGSEARDRSNYYLVQTPQTFQSGVLKRAYQQEYKLSFTDDASVVEASGSRIHMVEGDYKNIKVTTPEDLNVLGEFLRLTS